MINNSAHAMIEMISSGVKFEAHDSALASKTAHETIDCRSIYRAYRQGKYIKKETLHGKNPT